MVVTPGPWLYEFYSFSTVTFATWGNSGVVPYEGTGNQLSGKAHLMGPCNHGEPQWSTMSDWTCR